MSARQNPGYNDPKGIITFAFGGPAVGGILACGTTVPADQTIGYANGCIFIDRDAAAGAQVWINEGTVTSSLFKALYTSTGGTFANLTATNATITNATVTNGLIGNATLSANGTMTLGNLTNFSLGNGSGTRMGTANTQKYAEWGATPIVQPAGTGELVGMAGNGATNANAVNMTANGNTGSTAYSLNDVVKALKASGRLAS